MGSGAIRPAARGTNLAPPSARHLVSLSRTRAASRGACPRGRPSVLPISLRRRVSLSPPPVRHAVSALSLQDPSVAGTPLMLEKHLLHK